MAVPKLCRSRTALKRLGHDLACILTQRNHFAGLLQLVVFTAQYEQHAGTSDCLDDSCPDLASSLTAAPCDYTAGLCLMQLAVPRLRSASNLQKFNTALMAAGHDLAAWRVRANLPAKETAILDADNAAGWQLAEALLRPRKIVTDEETGTVKFINTNGQAARLGVSQALGHRFMQQVGSACLCSEMLSIQSKLEPQRHL